MTSGKRRFIYSVNGYKPPKKKKLKLPNLQHDEELLRLMKRKRVEQKFESEEGYGCPICGDPIHLQCECPCNDKIPPGTAISSSYDEVCIGCGKIGEICCNKGAYAVLRKCGPCSGIGHWYWDKVCTPLRSVFVKLPSIEELEDRVKNNDVKDEGVDSYWSNDVDSDLDDDKEEDYQYGRRDQKKLKLPDITHDAEELLRLMKRKRVEQEFESEEGYGCPICGDPIHLQCECPCNDKIPPGTAISSSYDEVCIGCGKIGEICCNKGAYAVLRKCGPCNGIGHWYWDKVCTPLRSVFAKLPSIEELEDRVKNKEVPSTDQSLENSVHAGQLLHSD